MNECWCPSLLLLGKLYMKQPGPTGLWGKRIYEGYTLPGVYTALFMERLRGLSQGCQHDYPILQMSNWGIERGNGWWGTRKGRAAHRLHHSVKTLRKSFNRFREMTFLGSPSKPVAGLRIEPMFPMSERAEQPPYGEGRGVGSCRKSLGISSCESFTERWHL